ncbi:MAG: hypothetical protein E2P02_06985 [Acidobacteria bacterium]|nr:MAG: hypothetical protein E2P02_06985 [Acidobacteriota bacterium]
MSDPQKPVPFRTTQGHLWMIEDQRFAASRPDVLVYETAVLEEDLTIAGPYPRASRGSDDGHRCGFRGEAHRRFSW